MITAEILNPLGELVYTVKFGGFEFALGLVIGGIAIKALFDQIRRIV